MSNPAPAARPAVPPLDLLVIGSGVAGLSAAVRAAEVHGLQVGVLTKGELEQGSTRWAQGGVAAVLDTDPDSTDLHLADTLAAGSGLCDRDAVRVLVEEGPARVNELIAMGAVFDRDPDGRLQLAREGGHSLARVVHAGGAATGAEVERALVVAVRDTAAALLERWFAFDLVVRAGRCAGVRALAPTGEVIEVAARNVLLATGGAGQLFSVTTNPVEVTGDGIAMALRAGVAVADVEFMQFHPTALHSSSMPRTLLTEALRGHGALIRDIRGGRFVDELQPRDVVSRAITAQMLTDGVDHVWLDATGLEQFADRFPTIAAALVQAGLDPAVDWLPIAPAAHYLSGGLVTDLRGATSLPGLWAAGEASCTGVHGANRLASNSLLEGMVFGPRVIEAIVAGVEGPERTGAMRCVLARGDEASPGEVGGMPVVSRGLSTIDADVVDDARIDAMRTALQGNFTREAGVLRSAESLTLAGAHALDARKRLGPPTTAAAWELANLCDVGLALAVSADTREESRGAHTRTDYPDRDDAHFRARLIHR
jgi:L-aspartate oxidase